MKLNLNKPICFFDLETTGTNPGKDRIVEIAVLKLDINNQKKTEKIQKNTYNIEMEMIWEIKLFF